MKSLLFFCHTNGKLAFKKFKLTSPIRQSSRSSAHSQSNTAARPSTPTLKITPTGTAEREEIVATTEYRDPDKMRALSVSSALSEEADSNDRSIVALSDVLRYISRQHGLSQSEVTSMLSDIDSQITNSLDSFKLTSDINCQISKLSETNDECFAALIKAIQKGGISRILVVICSSELSDLREIADLLRHNKFPATHIHADQRPSERTKNYNNFLHDTSKIIITDEKGARLLAGTPDAEFDHLIIMDCYTGTPDADASKLVTDLLFIRDPTRPLVMRSVNILCASDDTLSSSQCNNILRLVEIYARLCL